MADPNGQPSKRSFEPAESANGGSPKRLRASSFNTASNASSPSAGKDSRPKVYKCSYVPCTAIFSRPCRLEEHERSHTGERPFKCSHDGCEKTFSRDYHLSRHVALSHTNRRNFVCYHRKDGMGKIDSAEVEIGTPDNGDMAVDGPQEKSDVCLKAFGTAQRLREHEKTHEKKREFTCPECGLILRKKSTLQAHIAKDHRGVKPFPCPHNDPVSNLPCTAGYNTPGKLNEHVANHHNGMRYFCTVCTVPSDTRSSAPSSIADGGMEIDGRSTTTAATDITTTSSSSLGFPTMQALLAHNKLVHPPPPKPGQRRRIHSSEPERAPRQKKLRKRANQHTKLAEQNSSITAADFLTPWPRVKCLRHHCDLLFQNEDEMGDHCSNAHGMADVEIAEALREREALAGGVFWIGGVGPGLEDYDESEDENHPFFQGGDSGGDVLNMDSHGLEALLESAQGFAMPAMPPGMIDPTLLQDLKME
jgi:hypothetical protein